MAKRWSWIERAAAYDRHQAEVEERDLQQLRIQGELQRQRRELQRRDILWRATELLAVRIIEMIDQPVNTITEEFFMENGVKVIKRTIGVSFTYRDLARLALAMEKLSRAAVEVIEHDHEKSAETGPRVCGTFRLPRMNPQKSDIQERRAGVLESIETFRLRDQEVAEACG